MGGANFSVHTKELVTLGGGGGGGVGFLFGVLLFVGWLFLFLYIFSNLTISEDQN